MKCERCTIIFKGRVQGVGFRVTARHHAQQFPDLTGIVRNESDGSVYMVLEGQRERIEDCINQLRKAMVLCIDDEARRWSDGINDFESFSITG